MAVDGRIGGHDSPWFSGGLPGRYEHRLLPICCPDGADPTLVNQDRAPGPQHGKPLNYVRHGTLVGCGIRQVLPRWCEPEIGIIRIGCVEHVAGGDLEFVHEPDRVVDLVRLAAEGLL